MGKNENLSGKDLPYCRISFSWHVGQGTCMIHYPDHSIEMYVLLTFCQVGISSQLDQYDTLWLFAGLSSQLEHPLTVASRILLIVLVCNDGGLWHPVLCVKSFSGKLI